MSERLKLVALYNANGNEYFISAHNLSPEEAEQFIAQSQPECQPGYSLITLDQGSKHRITEAEHCRTCRDIVARSANLEPKPKFRRRKP